MIYHESRRCSNSSKQVLQGYKIIVYRLSIHTTCMTFPTLNFEESHLHFALWLVRECLRQERKEWLGGGEVYPFHSSILHQESFAFRRVKSFRFPYSNTFIIITCNSLNVQLNKYYMLGR